MEDKAKIWCRNCRKWFIVDTDTPIGIAVPGHTWGQGGSVLRHITDEDRREARAEREICPECGVPHGLNPYTGCGKW